MYSPELIRELHARLQAINPSVTILLGGSYAYGEAVEKSDIDFYAIVSFWQLIFYSELKKNIRQLKETFLAAQFNVMIVPRFFFEHGFFYIYGVDFNGAAQTSGANNSAFVRTTLKLALLHYMYFKISNDSRVQKQELIKCAQRVAALIVVHAGVYTFKPVFSVQFLLDQLRIKNGGLEKKLCAILRLKTTEGFKEELPTDAPEIAAEMLEYIVNLYTQTKKIYFRFSVLNYIVYTIQLWRTKLSFFLRQNPDIMVLDFMLECVAQGNAAILKNQKRIEEVVFPAIII